MFAVLVSISLAAQMTLQEVKTTLAFQDVTYEKVKGDCLDDFAKVEFEQDEDNILIRIGEKVIFPELGKANWKVNSGKNCEDIKTNQISTGKIVTTTKHQCSNKSKNFEIKSILEVKGDTLNLSINKTYVQKKKNSSVTCIYKIAKADK